MLNQAAKTFKELTHSLRASRERSGPSGFSMKVIFSLEELPKFIPVQSMQSMKEEITVALLDVLQDKAIQDEDQILSCKGKLADLCRIVERGQPWTDLEISENDTKEWNMVRSAVNSAKYLDPAYSRPATVPISSDPSKSNQVQAFDPLATRTRLSDTIQNALTLARFRAMYGGRDPREELQDCLKTLAGATGKLDNTTITTNFMEYSERLKDVHNEEEWRILQSDMYASFDDVNLMSEFLTEMGGEVAGCTKRAKRAFGSVGWFLENLPGNEEWDRKVSTALLEHGSKLPTPAEDTEISSRNEGGSGPERDDVDVTSTGPGGGSDDILDDAGWEDEINRQASLGLDTLSLEGAAYTQNPGEDQNVNHDTQASDRGGEQAGWDEESQHRSSTRIASSEDRSAIAGSRFGFDEVESKNPWGE